MTSLGNNGALTGAADPEDMTIGALLGALTAAAHRTLIFVYDGRAVQPGYHVTEVKVGQFQGLDCGANPESWTEIFVQLWDIPEDRPHMVADKFMKIIGKVMAPLALDAGAKLTFEVSDGVRPMQLYRAALPYAQGDTIRVDLSPRPSSCKPRDRWLEGQSCCGVSSGAKVCCG
jgi:hypothetical protein